MVEQTKKSGRFNKPSKCIQRMPRFQANDVPIIKSTQIVAGPEVDLVNISKSGACLGSSKSLAPGSVVRMKFVSEKGTFNVNGSVVRCNLHSLNKGVPYYHAGVKFSDEFALDLGNRPSILAQLEPSREAPLPEPQVCPEGMFASSNAEGESIPGQTILELTASIPTAMADLKKLLKGCESNSWVDF